jgi:hypothetical protein
MQYRIEHNLSSEVAEYNLEILKSHVEQIGDPKFEELCKPTIADLTLPEVKNEE